MYEKNIHTIAACMYKNDMHNYYSCMYENSMHIIAVASYIAILPACSLAIKIINL